MIVARTFARFSMGMFVHVLLICSYVQNIHLAIKSNTKTNIFGEVLSFSLILSLFKFFVTVVFGYDAEKSIVTIAVK